MNVEYRDSQEFSSEQLQELFESVEWLVGKYPEKLIIAMKNSGTVFSAWDDGKLVGLINAMDDGILNAYVHYLLVNPKYQGKGIGKELMRMMKEKYKDYRRIVLISYNKQVGFYQNSGLVASDESTAMFLDSF